MQISQPHPVTAIHPFTLREHGLTTRLSLMEKGLFGLAIFEIPLQLDKYFAFQEAHADFGAVAGLNVSITLLSLICLYGLWWMSPNAHAGQRLGQGRTLVLGVPMLIYLGLILLSSISAEVPFLSYCDGFNVLQAYLLFFYVANRVRCRSDVVFCVIALGATLLFQAFLIMGLAALGSGAHGQEFQLGPLVLAVWSDGRPAGTMQSAVLAGSTLAMIWLPVVGLALSQAPKYAKRFALLCLGFGLLGILLTQTRGAIGTTFLGAIGMGGALKMRGWLPHRVLIAAMVLAAIGAAPLAHVIRNRIVKSDGGSAIARKNLTEIAIHAISARPLFGYGAGNCHLACQHLAERAEFRNEWYYTIHSKYLLTWIETGLIGLVAFFAVLGNGLRHSFMTWLACDRGLSVIGLALGAALLGHMLHMSVDIFNSRTQVQMLWLLLGLAAAVYRLAISDATATQGVNPRVA